MNADHPFTIYHPEHGEATCCDSQFDGFAALGWSKDAPVAKSDAGTDPAAIQTDPVPAVPPVVVDHQPAAQGPDVAPAAAPAPAKKPKK